MEARLLTNSFATASWQSSRISVFTHCPRFIDAVHIAGRRSESVAATNRVEFWCDSQSILRCRVKLCSFSPPPRRLPLTTSAQADREHEMFFLKRSEPIGRDVEVIFQRRSPPRRTCALGKDLGRPRARHFSVSSTSGKRTFYELVFHRSDRYSVRRRSDHKRSNPMHVYGDGNRAKHHVLDRACRSEHPPPGERPQ